MSDCLFCKIAAHEIPSSIVYEDDDVIAFNDIYPQAPTHVLVVPKTHISTLNDLQPEHERLIGNVMQRAVAIAHERKIAMSGYRVVFNTNRHAGQTVFHIHLHLLGGRPLEWPPG